MVDWQTSLSKSHPAFSFPDIPLGVLAVDDFFLGQSAADSLFQHLTDNTAWRQEEIVLFGKRHNQPRLTAWYGLGMSAESKYTQSLPAQPWTPQLIEVKQAVEQAVGYSFNSVLLNLYRNGDDAMGMHADNEACLGPDPVIASLSLGVTRNFILKHRTLGEKVIVPAGHGQLMVMAGEIQRHWTHGINRSKKITNARLNLTFRQLR